MDDGHRTLNIVIDTTPLLLRSAGVKTVLYHWIHALQETGERVSTFPSLPLTAPIHHERSVAGNWATVKGIALIQATNRLGLPCPDWFAGDADIFHATNQMRRHPRRAKLTATVHDLTCWTMPDLHTRANVYADREYARRVLTGADGLIAVSENTRRDAIEILKIPSERIVAIHNGVAESYFEATAENARRVAAVFGLNKPYVLAVGTIEPRKNLVRLLDAWKAIPARLKAEYDLIVAGPAGWGSEDTTKRLRAADGSLRWLGYVREEYMPGLNRGASLLAYPSLYEGFGLPVAQAMAAGVPVLTSNVSSLPEVVGGAGRLISPMDCEEIAAALAAMLDSTPERERLGALGRERARSLFRWPLAARKSVEFFRRIAGR